MADEKLLFTEKVRQLSVEGLKNLINTVKSICTDALEKVDEKVFHIEVDKIDRKSMLQLENLMVEYLPKKSNNVEASPSKSQKK